LKQIWGDAGVGCVAWIWSLICRYRWPIRFGEAQVWDGSEKGMPNEVQDLFQFFEHIESKGEMEAKDKSGTPDRDYFGDANENTLKYKGNLVKTMDKLAARQAANHKNLLDELEARAGEITSTLSKVKIKK